MQYIVVKITQQQRALHAVEYHLDTVHVLHNVHVYFTLASRFKDLSLFY